MMNPGTAVRAAGAGAAAAARRAPSGNMYG